MPGADGDSSDSCALDEPPLKYDFMPVDVELVDEERSLLGGKGIGSSGNILRNWKGKCQASWQ